MSRRRSSEFIKTRGYKGYQKARFDVNIYTPNGKKITILEATAKLERKDKRRRRRKEYVTLVTINRSPRIALTHNFATKQQSITFWQGNSHGYAILEEEKAMRILAILLSLYSKNRDTIFADSTYFTERQQINLKWYASQMDESIKDGFRSWFRSARQHRRMRK